MSNLRRARWSKSSPVLLISLRWCWPRPMVSRQLRYPSIRLCWWHYCWDPGGGQQFWMSRWWWVLAEGLFQRTLVFSWIQARQRSVKPVYPTEKSAMQKPNMIVSGDAFYAVHIRVAYCPGSSVGRAADWKSACRWFESAPGHHYFMYIADM